MVTQWVPPGCSVVFSLSRVYGRLCPFFPRFSFPHQVWVATMCSSGRRCPCLVGPSVPPCSLLIVQSCGNFRRVVSGGGHTSLQCRLAFGDGCRSPPLLFFPVCFHILSVRCCGFSTGLTGPRFTHPALCWPRISRVGSVPSPLPFAGGSSVPGVLGFHGSGSLCSFLTLRLVSPFVPGKL